MRQGAYLDNRAKCDQKSRCFGVTFWDHRAPVLPNKRVRARGPDRPKSVRCSCCSCCSCSCHRFRLTFFPADFGALSETNQGGREDLGPPKSGIAHRFCHQKRSRVTPPPPSPSSWFSNTFSSSACGATCPRGFILVASDPIRNPLRSLRLLSGRKPHQSILLKGISIFVFFAPQALLEYCIRSVLKVDLFFC